MGPRIKSGDDAGKKAVGIFKGDALAAVGFMTHAGRRPAAPRLALATPGLALTPPGASFIVAAIVSPAAAEP